MSRNTLRIILWIFFTALWFGIWYGVKLLIHGSTDLFEAMIFFVIFGLLDSKGVDWIVNRVMDESNETGQK